MKIKSTRGRTRTLNPLIRSQMLYPVELRGHLWMQKYKIL